MAALRDRVRRTLARYYRQPFNTLGNTPAEIIHFCLAFGCDTEIHAGGPRDKRISGIGALCWNYPCAGYGLLQTGEGRFMARIGHGLQQKPGQFLAMLAQSNVNSSYEIRVGEEHGTVADLVEYEALTCRSGTDLSLKLIGLAHYFPESRIWNNDLGEEWSVERLIKEELDRSVNLSTCAATDHLMGLSFAVRRQAKRKQALKGQFRRAQDFINRYQEYALGLQNPDGSWHPRFFAYQGISQDRMGSLRSTGHILEWLAFWLPEDRLEDPQVVKSVAYVTTLLDNQGSGWSVSSMSPREIGTVMHGLHALAIYDRRVFKPRDPDKGRPGRSSGQRDGAP